MMANGMKRIKDEHRLRGPIFPHDFSHARVYHAPTSFLYLSNIYQLTACSHGQHIYYVHVWKWAWKSVSIYPTEWSLGGINKSNRQCNKCSRLVGKTHWAIPLWPLELLSMQKNHALSLDLGSDVVRSNVYVMSTRKSKIDSSFSRGFCKIFGEDLQNII